MAALRTCRQCGDTFTFKREDHFFCSGKCVAAYYRANRDPEDIHSPLHHENVSWCDTCGMPFRFNDYAKRGGQRKAKFCSSKCRQKAYRDRNGVSENRDFHNRQTRQQPPPPPPPRTPPPRHQVRGWDDALRLLGLENGFTAAELKRAYRDKMKACHPDVNHAPEATRQAQDVNWAFNYLRQH